jgi:membrane protease YdiL (CAAX protease family)
MINSPQDESREPLPGSASEIESPDDAARPTPIPNRASGEGAVADETPRPDLPAEIALGEPQPSGPDPFFVSYAQPGPQLHVPSDPPANARPPELFQSFSQLPVRPPARIPNFGHVGLLALLLVIGFLCTGAVFGLASFFLHIGTNALAHAAASNVQFILASEAILYLITFGLSLLVFPFFWHEKLSAGLQWRGAVALRRFWPLAATALGCAGLAALDEVLMPGPTNAPIDKMFSAPGAAWLMFAFGTTLAPFFEEMFFRGFLLPALCTAYDWSTEKFSHLSAPPLDSNGHPQWSLGAMVVGSILTSIPFALLHVEQQGHSLGPFLLLIVISLILCTVRLKTRSLAASTLVHAAYNFIIFSLALIGTSGFRHFDKM